MAFFWTYRRLKFLQKYKKEILNKVDYSCTTKYTDEELRYVDFTIYDRLNNKGFTKLIRKLYKLDSHEDYKIDCSFRKKFFKKIDYIRPQFDHSSLRSVGSIQFKKHNMIKEISISSTQINNEEALVAYTFTYEKLIHDENQINQYVKDHINELAFSNFLPILFNFDHFKEDQRQVEQYNSQVFFLIFQNFIVTKLYSEIGKEYILPKLCRFLSKEHTTELDNYLKDPFLEQTFREKNKDIFFVVDSTNRPDGISIDGYIFGTSWSHENLLSLFSTHKMDAYLTFFYNIEIDMLERKISKFLNSKRNSISSKDYKWLLDKLRKVEEVLMYDERSNAKNEVNWITHSKRSFSSRFIEKNKYRKRFKEIYRQNLEYLSAVHVSNYNSFILIVTIITLILTTLTFFS